MKPPRPPFRQHKNGDQANGHRPAPPDSDGGREHQDDAVKREAAYLRHLADEHTAVEVHLRTGEIIKGFVEYYDRQFIRLTRKGAPNLFIYKKDIKYFSEASGRESGKIPPLKSPR